MCCPTGLCGPSINPEMMRITTAMNTLEKSKVDIKRFNLTSNPDEFISNKVINEILVKDGEEVFPITLMNGEIVKKEKYPTNDELTHWTGIKLTNSAEKTLDKKIKEFVAIGAAIGSNCEMCFKYHYNEAIKLGISKEEIWQAVQMARTVKEVPAKSVFDLAKKICVGETEDTESDNIEHGEVTIGDDFGCGPGCGCR